MEDKNGKNEFRMRMLERLNIQLTRTVEHMSKDTGDDMYWEGYFNATQTAIRELVILE